MTWVIIILAIVGYIIYNFTKDREKMLERQVDLKGGMAKKYEVLISHLTNNPASNVIKVTRDHIHIRALGQTTSTDFFITENFNTVVIEWIAQLGLVGTHKKTWSFPHNYSQEKMLQEIIEYIDLKSNQLFNI